MVLIRDHKRMDRATVLFLSRIITKDKIESFDHGMDKR